MQFSIFLAKFPYKGVMEDTAADWLADLQCKLNKDPRCSRWWRRSFDDTPITMTRNEAAYMAAFEYGADFTLMLDNDMHPDIELRDGCSLAQPFWESSIDFMLNYGKPACIAAPYCGPPPHENVYVFKPSRLESDCPPHITDILKFEQHTREEAANRAGIEEVAALCTGLILIDNRIFKKLPPPWFEYEYTDQYKRHKASTEDVYMTRDTALIGAKQFINWDAWAGHWKRKCVRKPRPLTMDMIRENVRDAIVRGEQQFEKLVMVGEGRRQGVVMDARHAVRSNGNLGGNFRIPDAELAEVVAGVDRPRPPEGSPCSQPTNGVPCQTGPGQ